MSPLLLRQPTPDTLGTGPAADTVTVKLCGAVPAGGVAVSQVPPVVVTLNGTGPPVAPIETVCDPGALNVSCD